MTARNKVTILENFMAAPPPGSVPELSITLTCADMIWIGFLPVQRLIFYQHPVSNSFFLDTIIPGLKNSLSSALKYFPFLAGNLIISSDSTIPEIRYADGNSIPVVFAESSFPDFEYLVSDQQRNCSEFYPLLPEMPKPTESGGLKIIPLFALKVTLFPGKGICIGYSYQHVTGDGTSIISFVKAWSQICKSGENEAEKANLLSPVFDREVMRVHTKELDQDYWNNSREILLGDLAMEVDQLKLFPEDSDKVRTTFVISLEEIKRLKKHVSERKTSLKHLSTFTVVCGYIWACKIKSINDVIDRIDENEEEYFIFGADCRGRTNPAVPSNYFGNCLVSIMVIGKTLELCGDEGFAAASELIGDTLHKRLNCDEGVFQGILTISEDIAKVKDYSKIMSVGGSPRQNYYDLDFGWGKPRTVEMPSSDPSGAMSLARCRDESGGVEIGLALPKRRMDVFTEIFREGLQALNI